MPELSNRTAIVTGAGRGIGRAVARALTLGGARVALLARTGSQLDDVAADLSRLPLAEGGGRPEARAIACDVTDPVSVDRAVTAAESALGAAEILVNAAGDARSAPLTKTDEALWNAMIGVNLTGTFLMTRRVAPGMIEQGRGRIINIASIAGLRGGAYVAAYTAAKHGVVGLTRALAVELAKHGITVNAVCPGYVDTPMTDRSVANIAARTGMSEQDARRALAARSLQNRLIDPEEVAVLVRYLATDEAKGITGQAIPIDGGTPSA